jgi:hypothetical protein
MIASAKHSRENHINQKTANVFGGVQLLRHLTRKVLIESALNIDFGEFASLSDFIGGKFLAFAGDIGFFTVGL